MQQTPKCDEALGRHAAGSPPHTALSENAVVVAMATLCLQAGDAERAVELLEGVRFPPIYGHLGDILKGVAKRIASKSKAKAKREATPKDPPLLRSCVKLLEERLGRPLEVWSEIAKLRAFLRRWEAKAESIELQLKYSVMRENINDKFFVRNVIDATGKAMVQSGRKATGAVKEWRGGDYD